jgi:protein TonB
MEDNKKYLNQSMDEIVFDNRNKAYGAYFLRQLTRRNTFRAMVVMTGMSALLTGFTFVDFGSLLNKDDEETVEIVANLTEPPPLDEAAPPPPPPPPPPEEPPPPLPPPLLLGGVDAEAIVLLIPLERPEVKVRIFKLLPCILKYAGW